MTWIKLDSATPRKPEILRLARILGLTVDDAFGKVMRFWLWVDGVTVDGHVDGVTSTDVDAIVDRAGFADALQQVGWLVCDDQAERVTIPNFEYHNGETAKKRASKTKRQAKWRKSVDANVDTTPSTSASTRGEKRREEKSTPPPPNTTCTIPANESDAGGGGGISESEPRGAAARLWLAIETRLAKLGVADAVGACRSARNRGLTADAVAAIANVYDAARGAWGPGALHYRITQGVPGVPAADGWPERADQPEAADAARDYKRRKQAEVAKEGRRMEMCKRLRREGKTPEEVDAALATAGLA